MFQQKVYNVLLTDPATIDPQQRICGQDKLFVVIRDGLQPVSYTHLENIPPLLPAARPEPTDQDIRDMAFGSMQRRITELVTADFPNARWVWKTPNAMHNICLLYTSRCV